VSCSARQNDKVQIYSFCTLVLAAFMYIYIVYNSHPQSLKHTLTNSVWRVKAFVRKDVDDYFCPS